MAKYEKDKTAFKGAEPNYDFEVYELRRQKLILEVSYGYTNRYFESPIDARLESGEDVLELGCGAGLWTIAMAKAYPNSRITGLDLIDLFPTENVPSNVALRVHDVTKRFPFDDESFDFVCMRYLITGIPMARWKSIIDEAIRVLRKGGHLELLHTDFFVYPPRSPAVIKLNETLRPVLHAIQLTPDIADNISMLLAADGRLGPPTSTVADWGLGWGIKGDELADAFDVFLFELKPLFQDQAGMSDGEINELIRDLRAECVQHKCYSPQVTYFVKKIR